MHRLLKIKFSKKRLIGCALMALPLHSYAADNKAVNEVNLGDIDVIDKRDKFDNEYLDRQKIARFRGTTNGDAFSGISGVQVNSLRNEAGALDIGIRGVQGEGRVPIVIDGSLQSSHTFRGYQGESDRTYIDMDLISTVQVDKGATAGKYSTGAIGGLVQMKTLGVKDILLPGENFGLLFKGSTYNNNRKPKISGDAEEQEHYLMANGIKPNSFNNGSATVAMAYQNDLLDLVLAYSKRAVGNYFAGARGIERYGDDATVSAGQEVVNTSYQSDSGIAKLGLNLDDSQRLELNFRRHVQKAGEVMAAYWYKHPHKGGDDSVEYAWYAPDGVDSMPQWSLGSAIVNSYSANYSYTPESSNLIDFTLGVWKTTAHFDQHNGAGSGGSYGDQYKHSYGDDRQGINISNHSSLTTLPLSFDYGAALDEQRMQPRGREIANTISRNGRRTEQSGYLNAMLDYPLVTLNLGGKVHQAAVTDYQDQNHIDYGAKTDLLSQLKLHLTNQIDLYAKASNTYRNPSLFESTRSAQTFNYDRHNPLRPENARSWEVGFSGEFNDVFTKDEQIDFRVGYFNNRIKDFISASQLPRNPDDPWWRSNFAFRNYDRVTLKGTELTMSYDNQRFFADASAIFYRKPEICSRATAEQNNGPACTDVGYAWSMISARIPPKRTFNLTVGTRLLDGDLTLGSRLRYHSGKKNPQDWLQGTAARAVVEVPSEKIVDLFASYRVNPQLELTFNIDNLTNRYAFDPGTVIGMPMPGR
ncbi:TonB-dependent receptor domain-containing protein, partial [Serratia nevei]|uniref:TonB-dependent receptor domain-containing protein n=1 Tax=Serratia nevei TaxID=2703794 RepID=UPI003FA6A308